MLCFYAVDSLKVLSRKKYVCSLWHARFDQFQERDFLVRVRTRENGNHFWTLACFEPETWVC
jgi:hypothetical protein